jgi:hypothetical protein
VNVASKSKIGTRPLGALFQRNTFLKCSRPAAACFHRCSRCQRSIFRPERCLEGAEGEWIEVDYEKCLDRIRSDAALRFEWERYFLHFAGYSLKSKMEASILTDPVLTKQQMVVKFQLTSAMEFFVVAHEYGHHIAQHNTGDGASSSVPLEEAIRHEFEADEIAWQISRLLRAMGFAGQPTKVRNMWMESCAGVVHFLVAADLVRRTHQVLMTGEHSDQESSTHPSARDRIQALRDWPAFAADPLLEDIRHRRRFVDRLLVGAFNQVVPRF